MIYIHKLTARLKHFNIFTPLYVYGEILSSRGKVAHLSKPLKRHTDNFRNGDGWLSRRTDDFAPDGRYIRCVTHLPAGGVASEVSKVVCEPSIDFMEGQLHLRRLADRLNTGRAKHVETENLHFSKNLIFIVIALSSRHQQLSIHHCNHATCLTLYKHGTILYLCLNSIQQTSSVESVPFCKTLILSRKLNWKVIYIIKVKRPLWSAYLPTL